jgi:hypothetical protein
MRIQVDWEGSAESSPTTLEFLIDTGATRSCIDMNNARGMQLVAMVGVQGVSATPSQLLLLGGGQMEFDVEDQSSGATETIKHVGDVLLTSQRLIGQDVFSTQSLGLIMDFSVAPPSIRLVR